MIDTIQPPVVYRDRVHSEWIDRNGHMNMGYYSVAFDEATTLWFDLCGLTTDYRRRHGVATFSAEGHTTYERELYEGDPLHVTTQLLDFTDKKIHYFHRMYHSEAGYLAATNELLTLHVDVQQRRATAMDSEIRARLEEMQDLHRDLPRPPQAGRVIGVRAARPNHS